LQRGADIVKAIILGAGQGRRLMPLTERMPKCCLQLDGKSMLEWQVEALAANQVEEVVVVTGFARHMVEHVVSNIRGIPVRTLYNPFYAMSDNLGTCWVVRSEMNGPFLLINGDTLFEHALLKRLLGKRKTYPITLAADRKESYDEDDMKIIARGDQLLRVGKRLEPEQVNGESIGMMVFNQVGAEIFVRQVEQLMGGPDGLARWYLSAIDELAQKGQVGICSINGLSWCEVDDLDDLAHAAKVVGGWQKERPQQAAHAGNSNTNPPQPGEIAGKP
jgi:choline kinase